MNRHPFNTLIAACTFVASFVTLVGCSSEGKAFDVDNVELVYKGTTTKSEIFEFFGEPLRREVGLYGEVWTYTHMDSRATAAGILGLITIGVDQSKTDVNKLRVLLEDDIVKDYHFSSSSRINSYAH